ncbi:MAG: T9SS type A sorting domain-containing protein [Bacteroidota bacterium]
MKLLLTLLFLPVTVLTVVGQGPVFDESWFPGIGAQFVGQSASGAGVSAAQTGPDQMWDFSNLADSSNQKVTSYIDPISTDNGVWYVGTNLASSEDGTFSFFEKTATQVDYFGEYNDLFSVVLTDPANQFQFPFSYGTMFTDSLQGTLDFSGITLHRSGEVSFEADGYGTLILPDGRTFEDVLRYRYTQHTVDEHNTQGVVFTSFSESYVWISPICPEPLLRISYFSQDNGQSTFASKSVFYSLGVFTSVEENLQEEINISAFPNPSEGVVNLRLPEGLSEDLDYILFDLNGRMASSGKLSGGINLLNFDHLPQGLYVLNASTSNQSISIRISLF